MLGFPIATYPVGAGVSSAAGTAPPPADTTLPTPGSTPSAPSAADLYLFTIMQMSTINLQAQLGPASINLTVSFS